MTNATNILKEPRITEKAAYLAEQGCYVFNVAVGANKAQIAEAIRAIYKVSPRKVTMVAIQKKAVQTRGTNRVGSTRGGKKAYVFLKKGDKIELS
ncbi:MAG: 50S ribosomal protein L23 [Patescibacteria group bacterium]